MMTKIFKDKKEPLYNRQSRFMTVRPFTPSVLKEFWRNIIPPIHRKTCWLCTLSREAWPSMYNCWWMQELLPSSHA